MSTTPLEEQVAAAEAKLQALAAKKAEIDRQAAEERRQRQTAWANQVVAAWSDDLGTASQGVADAQAAFTAAVGIGWAEAVAAYREGQRAVALCSTRGARASTALGFLGRQTFEDGS